MALAVADRVKETSTTAGTGTLTLLGAVTGYQSFSVIGSGNTTYYCIVDDNTGAWEVGVGTYTSPNQLSRDTILSSSTGGTAVTFLGNIKQVFVTYPAERSVYENAAGSLVLSKVEATTGIITNLTSTSAVLTNVSATSATVTNLTLTSLTLSSLSISNFSAASATITTGNLTFSSTAQRITGDMSTATFGNRLAFQTSTSNSATSITALPSGTGTASNINCYNNSDPTNSSLLLAGTNASEALIQSAIRGTGTYLPLTFYTGGSERVRIDTSGNVGIGGTANSAIRLDSVGTMPSAATAYNIAARGAASASTTSAFSAFYASPSTAASLTITNINYFNADAASFGAGAAVTNQYGFIAQSNLTGATNNYGFYGNIASGANRYNVYMNGTAANYFNGIVGIGALPGGAVGDEKLRVKGTDTDSFVITWEDSVGDRIGGLYANASVVGVGSVTNHPLILQTNQVERVRIDTAGTMSMGTAVGQKMNWYLSGTIKYGVSIASGELRTYAATGNALTFGAMSTSDGTTFSEQMRIDSSGNVGIGTASPGEKLTISGTPNTKLAVIDTVGGAKSIIQSQAGNLSVFGSENSVPVAIYTNNSERVRIDTSGNVGIGTAGPSGNLQVSAANPRIRFSNTAGTASTLLFGADSGQVFLGAETNAPIYFITNNAERMRITSTGGVGIGTSSPAQLFSVYTTGEWPILARGASDTAGNRMSVFLSQRARGSLASPTVPIVDTNLGGIEMGGWNGSAYTYGYNGGAAIFAHASETWTASANGTYLAFSTTAAGAASLSERMRIDSSGNVGIGGTAGAAEKVTLTGTLPTSSNFSFGYLMIGTVPSGTTSLAINYFSRSTTAAASFTLSNYRHFQAEQGTFGAGSAVTNQYGFFADSSLTGATNNFGFYSNIASGTNRWNFYAAGTALNYFAGNVGIGTTSPGTTLEVFTASTTNGIRIKRFTGNYYSELRQVDSPEGLAFLVGDGSTVAERMRITGTGNVIAGSSAALATNATDGFLYVPTCAGTPTGTPTAITGMAPIVVNTTNNKLYFYSGGAWRDAGP